MKQIKWHKKAVKQIRKIKNLQTKNKIYDAVGMLSSFPNCRNVKKLANRDDYRLRVGSWRVIFTADLEIIQIEEVKKRDEQTY
ncbi:MAG: type II toxin-antitoxin system RelE/ParE family toxin [Desulfobacula sp.]|jgi:mRNA interferase RelE/StbE|nr:type II toxin-antitoxin system RelE/ParE family toxin [Desulfobacula sp.]